MFNILIILLSIVDFAGAILHVWPIPGDFMLMISLILVVKGVWSIISSLYYGFYYDLLGLLDFITGLILLIVNFGTPLSFGWIFGLLLGLKATYTLITSLSLAK